MGRPEGLGKTDSGSATARDPLVESARVLVQRCQAELNETSDPARCARLHCHIGHAWEGPLGDLSRAARHYQQALSFAPDLLPAIRGARRVLLGNAKYSEAVPLFDAEARLSSDPKQKAVLYYEKGGVYENQVGDGGKAREAYEAALELDRGNPSLLKAVERCYRQAGDRAGLARVFERLANSLGDDAPLRAAVLVERARLLGDKQRNVAIELLETALRLDPRTPGAGEELKRYYRATGRWQELIDVLEAEAKQAQDPAVAATALHAIGRIHAAELGNRNEAVDALLRAVKLAPEDRLIVEDLTRLLDAAEDYAALSHLLEGELALAKEPAERVALHHRLGEICEIHLGVEERAIRHYRAALEVEPSYLPAVQALAKLYAAGQRWSDLVAMHLAEADASDDLSRRAAAHAGAADIYEARLGSPGDAAEHHARALALVPGYPSSFKALTRLYAQAGAFRKLVELYESAVDGAPSDTYRLTYLFKIGALWEDFLDDPVQAAHAYRRVLEIDRDNLAAVHALQRVAERAGRYRELVDLLDCESELTSDVDQLISLAFRAGTVLDEHLDDRDGAIARFRRAVELDSASVSALAALGRIYYRTGRWRELLDIYERELEVTQDRSRATVLCHRMGELCEERLGLEDEAISHYRRAIARDPSYRPPLLALARRFEERRDWEGLLGVLQVQLAGSVDPMRRAAVLYRMGELYEQRLREPLRAIAVHEQALAEVPGFRPSIEALTRLRWQQGAWSTLLQHLTRDQQETSDPTRTASTLWQQGAIWRDKIGNSARAAACFEALLHAEPGRLAALVALEPIYDEAQDKQALARTYARQADAFSDAGARAAALRELARLQEYDGVGERDDVLAT